MANTESVAIAETGHETASRLAGNPGAIEEREETQSVRDNPDERVLLRRYPRLDIERLPIDLLEMTIPFHPAQ